MIRIKTLGTSYNLIWNGENKNIGQLDATDEVIRQLLSNPEEPKYWTEDGKPCGSLFGFYFLDRENKYCERKTRFLKGYDSDYIVIDIDANNRIKIEEFINEWKDFHFWLFTTRSHKKLDFKKNPVPDGTGEDCFRVILKLKMLDGKYITDFERECSWWNMKRLDMKNDFINECWKSYWNNIFPFCDQSGFDRLHMQFCPLDIPGYYWMENIGNPYEPDHSDWETVVVEKEELETELYEKFMNHIPVYKDVETSESVNYYLSSDFSKLSGNGDSNTSLYNAIVKCMANEDTKSFEKVIEKAKSERWTQSDINRKIKDAEKFLYKKRGN